MYPTMKMRVRHFLGACSSCWSPSEFTMTVSWHDVDGNELKSVDLKACRCHRDEHIASISKTPHRGSAHIEGVGEVNWFGLGDVDSVPVAAVDVPPVHGDYDC